MIDNSVRWVQRPSLLEGEKGLTPGAANSIPRRKATLKEFSGNAFFGLWPYAGQGVFENFPILSGVAGGVGGAKAKSGLGLCVLCQRERERRVRRRRRRRRLCSAASGLLVSFHHS